MARFSKTYTLRISNGIPSRIETNQLIRLIKMLSEVTILVIYFLLGSIAFIMPISFVRSEVCAFIAAASPKQDTTTNMQMIKRNVCRVTVKCPEAMAFKSVLL